MTHLHALSPLDGRYQKQTQSINQYFSEFALIRFRVRVEIEYLVFFLDTTKLRNPELTQTEIDELRNIYLNFSESDALRVKEIEKTTNHDVKAVEYFLREKISEKGILMNPEWIHFGLTSQDINNTAFPLMLSEAIAHILIPAMSDMCREVEQLAIECKSITMLAHTHGQPATPTNLGKELMVFRERLANTINQISNIRPSGKFGGASGNYNAHKVAFPDINWMQFGDDFLQSIGLKRQQFTTQIEQYDDMAATFDALKRTSVVLMDLCRDCWLYISMNYFSQQTREGEVGSSAMPHKVNPIDFENAEGNLGLCIAILEHLSGKLPISRLQRDLTDSTVLRNIGVPLGHLLISISSVRRGLGKLKPNVEKINRDLEENWAIVAEAIQTVLRREGYPHPYEALRKFSRGNTGLTRTTMIEFIDTLSVSNEIKAELKNITPFNYTGQFPDF